MKLSLWSRLLKSDLKNKRSSANRHRLERRLIAPEPLEPRLLLSTQNSSEVCLDNGAPTSQDIATQTPTYTWSSVAGAASYELRIQDLASGDWETLLVSGTSTSAPSTLNDGWHRAWVRGVSGAGAKLTWSNGYDFNVATAAGTPTVSPLGPTGFVRDFTWSAQSGAIEYEVEVRDATMGGLGVQVFREKTSETIWRHSETLPDGPYLLWTRHRTASGWQSWSPAYSFDVETTPGNVNPTGDVPDFTPDFSWGEISGAASYDFWVNIEGQNQIAEIERRGLEATTYSVLPSEDLPYGEYNVWIKAYDMYGHVHTEAGAWSFDRFTVGLPVENVSPSTTIGLDGREFSWDPHPIAVSYDLQVSLVGQSSNPIINLSGLSQTSHVESTLLAAAGYSEELLLDGDYEIKVRAAAANGFTGEWSISAFTVDSQPQNVQVSPGPFTTYINWESVSQASGYNVWLNRVVDGVASFLSLTEVSYNFSSESLGLGSYRVWIQGLDQYGAGGEWSAPADFSVDGTTDFLQKPTVVGDSSPTLEWNSVLGATGYELWVNEIEGGLAHAHFIEPNLSSTSFTVPDNVPGVTLVEGNTYKAHVRALADGYTSPWSPPYVFAVNAVPTIGLPFADSSAAQSTFSWATDSDDIGYNVRLNSSTFDETQVSVVDSGNNLTEHRFSTSQMLPDSLYELEVQELNVGGVGQYALPQITLDYNTPRFSWASTPDAYVYDIRVNRIDNGSQPVVIENGIYDNVFQHSSYLEDGLYELLVRSHHYMGGANLWSAPYRFVIDTNCEAPDIAVDQNQLVVEDTAYNGAVVGTVTATDADGTTDFSNWRFLIDGELEEDDHLCEDDNGYGGGMGSGGYGGVTGGGAPVFSSTSGAFGIRPLAGTTDQAEIFVQNRNLLNLQTLSEKTVPITIVVDDSDVYGSGNNIVLTNSLDTSVLVKENEPATIDVVPVTTSIHEGTLTSRIHVANIVVSDDGLGVNNVFETSSDFSIEDNKIYVNAGTILDFETQPTLNVTVNVDDAAIPGNPDDSDSLTIHVVDVNEPPRIEVTILSDPIPELENLNGAFAVADINIIDDALGNNNLLLHSPIAPNAGVNAHLFEIVNNQLMLRADADVNQAITPFNVFFGVDDPTVGSAVDDSYVHFFGIDLAPKLTPTQFVFAATENTTVSDRIATFSLLHYDPQKDSVLLTGEDAGLFNLVNNRDIYLKPDADLDFESNPQLDVTVEVDDPASPTLDPDASASFTITINDVNDLPEALFSTVTTDEDVPYQFTAGDFLYDDEENHPITSITILPIDQFFTGDLFLNGELFDGGTLAVGNIGELDGHIDDLEYRSPYENFNEQPYPQFGFTVNDADSGTVSASMRVYVTPVNDPPRAFPETGSTIEDTPYQAFTASSFHYDDAEGDMAQSITVSSLNLLNGGKLELTNHSPPLLLQDGSTFDFGEVEYLKFTPPLDGFNPHGTPPTSQFAFAVNDEDPGIETALFSFNVSGRDDAPRALASTINVTEDIPFPLTTSRFDFDDPDGDSITEVTIQTLPSVGTLSYNGANIAGLSDWTFPTFGLVYTPPQNQSGTPLDSFEFTVNNHAAGVQAATMSVNVSPVNDPPNAEDKTIIVIEGTSYTYSSGSFGFSDPDGDSLAAVTITGHNLHGATLKLNGLSAPLNAPISILDLTGLVFTPPPNSGDFDATVDFRVSDQSQQSANTATLTMRVTGVNDAPAIDLDDDDSGTSAGAFQSIFVEDGTPVNIADIDALVTDVDGPAITRLTASLPFRPDGTNEFLEADTTGTSLVKTWQNGVLTISGNGSPELYTQVLRTMSYCQLLCSENFDLGDDFGLDCVVL